MELTPKNVSAYLNRVCKRSDPNFSISSGFRPNGFTIENGLVNSGDFTVSIPRTDLTDIWFKFGKMECGLIISVCQVKDLTFLPKTTTHISMNFLTDKDTNPLKAIMYVPVLLIKISDSLTVDDDDLHEILMNGRNNDGRMPGELIPEKINQLRDLDQS
jgi:hypothetical protein